MVEDTTVDGDVVVVGKAARPGDHVRPAGEDLAAGQVVFEPFTRLGPGHLGVLASLGYQRVPVFRRARVGVLSTGDELVDDGGPLRPGQIRDSNRPTLTAMVQQAGCDAIDLGTVADDEAAIVAVLERGLAGCDALVTSGGVSMGDFDYIKVVLDRMGAMRWMAGGHQAGQATRVRDRRGQAGVRAAWQSRSRRWCRSSSSPAPRCGR